MAEADAIREVLRQVAAGELSPQEAAARIPDLQRPSGVAVEEAVRKVRVSGLVYPTRIVGDPGVKDAVVQGPHQVSREGDCLLVQGQAGGEDGGWFTFGWPERSPFGWGPGSHPLRTVSIRMNPKLALEVEMAAGMLTVQGVTGAIKADIQAGRAKVEGLVGPIDLNLACGTVSVSGVMRQASSTIRCEAGTVRARLERGSSVKVVARSTMGKISLPGDEAGLLGGWTVGGDVREVTVGAGEASLDIDATTGVVWVESE